MSEPLKIWHGERVYGLTEIEERRHRLEWTRKIFAKRAGIQYMTVLRIEQKKTTRFSSRYAAVRALQKAEEYVERVAERLAKAKGNLP